MELELRALDRLMLINQYEILKAIDPDNADHYEALIDILRNGFTIFYRELVGALSPDVNASDLRMVLDTLEMYRFLGDFFGSNPQDASASNHWATFRGFDGNNEPELLTFALFLVERQGKFSEQKDNLAKTDHFNSHAPCREKYEAMLVEWKRQPDKYRLTSAGVATILNAKVPGWN